jgi:hypothetical protein
MYLRIPTAGRARIDEAVEELRKMTRINELLHRCAILMRDASESNSIGYVHRIGIHTGSAKYPANWMLSKSHGCSLRVIGSLFDFV